MLNTDSPDFSGSALCKNLHDSELCACVEIGFFEMCFMMWDNWLCLFS